MRAAAGSDGGSKLPSLREFEVLRAVVEHRTTAAAARALDLSQPAVSRTLAALEGRLGRRLFVRGGGALVPTEDAVALSEGAHGPIQALRRLVRGGEFAQGTDAGGLQVVTTATLAQCWLTRVLPGLLRARPEMRVGVEVATSAAVLTAVADGTADAGLVDGFAPHGSLSAEVVHRDRAHLVAPSGHPLADGGGAVGVADLAGVPFVALPRRFALRARVDAAFRDAGLRPRVAVECATAVLAAEMVLRGVGVAVLNAFPLRDAYPGLAFRPFSPAVAMETAVVVSAAAPPKPSVARFVEALRGDIPPPSPPEEAPPA